MLSCQLWVNVRYTEHALENHLQCPMWQNTNSKQSTDNHHFYKVIMLCTGQYKWSFFHREFCTQCSVITIQIREKHLVKHMHDQLKYAWLSHSSQARSSQTKNIHVNEPDSTLSLKSLSNSTEDYSFLNLESCDALPQEIHRFRFLFQKSA